MANIFLKHHIHGTKIATLEAEAIYDEMSGWVRYDPSVTVKAVETKTEEAPVDNAMKSRRKAPVAE